jgi:hypothetical protein
MYVYDLRSYRCRSLSANFTLHVREVSDGLPREIPTPDELELKFGYYIGLESRIVLQDN